MYTCLPAVFIFNESACNVSQIQEMKKAVLNFIVFNVIGFAVAQQTIVYTKYTNNDCPSTKAPSPTDEGVSNPLIIPVNSCVLWSAVTGKTKYIKVAPCNQKESGFMIFTNKTICDAATASQLTDTIYTEGYLHTPWDGTCSSFRCSSASFLSFSLLFAVTPLLAFCL